MAGASDEREPSVFERFYDALDKAAPLAAGNERFAAMLDAVTSGPGEGPAFGPSLATPEIWGSAGGGGAGDFTKALHEEEAARRIQANAQMLGGAEQVRSILKSEDAQARNAAHAEAVRARYPNEAWDQSSLARYSEYGNFCRGQSRDR
jgi:hypothetical protein